MKKLSSETERKLMRCIDTASEMIGEHDCPNEGIAKAAVANGVRPGEVALVVQAYNTGRTARQRESGDDPFTKAADFPLADTAAVLEIMYPGQVKSAGQAFQDETVHPVYGFSPKPFLERKARREKAAEAVDWRTIAGEPVKPPEPYPPDPKEAMKRAASNVDRSKRAMEEQRMKVANAFDAMASHFMDLTEYFRRPDATPIPVVKEAVILMHGDKGEQIFDELVKVTPALTKFSNHRLGDSLLYPGQTKFPAVDDLDCSGEPFGKVAELIAAIDTYKQEKTAYEESAQSHTDLEAKELGPFAVPAVSPSILGQSSDDPIEGEKRAFSLPGLALGASLTRNVSQANKTMKGDPDRAVESTLAELDDPDHEQRLRMINTQSMLQDMMVNDPVISSHDPDEVATAFNDIVQLAPRAADQRMLMQTLLRKQLQQGQLDNFDMDQLLGMNEKLQKREIPSGKGMGAGNASIL